MRARGRLICLACAVCALFALTAAASASATGREVRSKSLFLHLDLKASNGYKAAIDAEGNYVTLTLMGRRTEVSYRVRGQVSLSRIEADFGSLGHISAQLVGRPPKRIRKHRRGCKGRGSVVVYRGTYRGTFRFAGEEGFSQIATHHADGEGARRFRLVCGSRLRSGRASGAAKPSRARPPAPTVTVLSAYGKSVQRAVYFEALGVEGASRARRDVEPGLLVIAASIERHDGLTIIRSTYLEEVPDSVLLSGPKVKPITATVAPPAPFEGTASYLENPGAPASWTGDLKVSLPGAPPALLTGPEFIADFCRGIGERQTRRCFETAAGTRTAQLNGSHSQPFGETRLSWLR